MSVLIRQTEAVLQSLLDAATEDSIWLFDQRGNIVLANLTAAGKFGKSPDEMMGRQIAEFLPPQIYESRMTHLRKVFETGDTLKFEDARDGIMFQHSLSPVFLDGQIVAVASYSRDITRQKSYDEERRATEEKLRDGERKLRVALESAKLGTFEIDAVTGAISWDERSVEIFGVGPDEPPTSELCKTLTHTEDWDRAEAALSAALDPNGDGWYEAEFRVNCPDGTCRWVLGKGRVHFVGEGAARRAVGLNGVNMDISQRKLSEEALRQNQEKFRIMGEILPYGVWLCDAEGKSQYVSPSFLELLNMTLEEQREFGWTSRLVPEDLPGMMEKWLKCVKTGEEWDSEHRIVDRKGEIRKVLTRGRPVRDHKGVVTGWAGVNLDITERKRSEEALKLATEKALFFSTALENSSQPFAAGSPDGALINFNKAFTGLTGYTEEELRTTTWAEDLTPEEWREHEAKVLQKLVKTGEPQLYEKEYLRKDGTPVPLEIKVHLAHDQSGKPYFYSFLTDVTERKRAAEDLLQAHEQLELRVAERTKELQEKIEELHEKESLLVQQSRLAAMGEMIENIAHQWRQPLNVLALMVQQIQIFYSCGVTQDRVDEAVASAMTVIEHMSDTIDDFRDFLRPNKDAVAFSISDVVDTTLKLLKPSFDHSNIRIEVVHEGDALVFGSPGEMSQVIMNLLSNSRDALSEKDISGPLISVTTGVVDGKATLSVTDNAGGIPTVILDKIFEPRFSTKQNGTGIGLFMSKHIIEKAMGGTLAVTNTGDGATFEVVVHQAVPDSAGGS